MRVALRLVVVLAAIASVGAGGYLLWPRGGAAGQIPTYEVVADSFRREVPADGTLKAVQSTPITAPQEVRMALKVAWMVDDGTRVAAGEVVVRFDPSEMSDRLRDGLDSTSQVNKRISVEGTSSGSARRKRDREASLAEAEMTAAASRTYADSEVFSRNEIIESQIDKELASAKMTHARAAKAIERSVSSGKLQVLEVQKRQAELHVNRAKKALSTLELTAPHAGVLLLSRDWRGRTISVGDTVWPGQKVAEVPEDGAMEASVFVLEADGGALEVGMPATVFLESQPSVEFPASIKRVETLAKPRVAEVPVQYFGVVLAIDADKAPPMKIGQRVRARILTSEVDALAVPRQAVLSAGGKSYVYRARGGDWDRVEVELGAGTAGRVIVVAGLEAGDRVALRPPGGGGADAGSEQSRGEGDRAPR